MPDIRILHAHTQGAASVRATIRAHEHPVAHRYGLKTRWDAGALCVERAGMKARIEIDEEQVQVKVHVPWVFRGFVEQIEDKLRQKLAFYFC